MKNFLIQSINSQSEYSEYIKREFEKNNITIDSEAARDLIDIFSQMYPQWESFKQETGRWTSQAHNISSIPRSEMTESPLPPPIPMPEAKSKCDCGAKHTSFPNHHSEWCTVEEYKRNKDKHKVVDPFSWD